MPFMATSLFGWSVIKVPSTKMREMFPHVRVSSIKDGDEPAGWIASWWFIGYISKTGGERAESNDLYIFMRVKTSHTLFDGKKIGNAVKSITYFERSGDFFRTRYDKRELTDLVFTPRENQQSVIETIVKMFNETKSTVILLTGPPGTGKSTISYCIATYLLSVCKGISFTDTFNPTTPGDDFGALYRKVNPTKDKPLIILLDEVDGLIDKVKSSIPEHQYVPTQVRCKTTWNTWLDKIDRGFYPFVIMIMTSNKSIQWFDEIDRSYMREGRVQLKMVIE